MQAIAERADRRTPSGLLLARSLGVFTIDERITAARTWLDTEDRRMSGPRGDAGMDAFRWEIATGISVTAVS